MKDCRRQERELKAQLEALNSAPLGPTPSITVGTQVRLIGVMTSAPSERDGAVAVQIGGAAGPADTVFVFPEALEVIRQPFKRGEVVYRPGQNIPCVVLVSESNGRVVLTEAREGACAREMIATEYERRP